MPQPLIPIERFEIFANGLDHPECCAFDRDGTLWAGGEAGQVYRIDPAGRVEQITKLGTFKAGVAVSPDNESVLVCNPAQGIVRVRRDGTHDVFASHAGAHKIACSNFGLFDATGNYWVTDSGEWRKRNGYLLRFAPAGRGERVAGPFGYANGLALSADEKTLFMVESDTNRVWRFDIRDGKHEVLAENVGRLPDGLALDEDGLLYVACYASDELRIVIGKQKHEQCAQDPFAILLSRPTNLTFRDGYVYVANLGRTTITRAKL